ncbi:MAG: hypothetical protein WBA11_14175, partial [Rubrivirga sp.]
MTTPSMFDLEVERAPKLIRRSALQYAPTDASSPVPTSRSVLLGPTADTRPASSSRPTMMRHLSLALTAALVLSACGGDEAAGTAEAEAPRDTSIPVEVVVATPTYFEDTIELTGTVDADNDATLSPDVPGMLTYVAPVGSFVRAGQTVAQV